MQNKTIIGAAIAVVVLIVIVLVLKGNKNKATGDIPAVEKDVPPVPTNQTPTLPVPEDSPAFCTGKFKDVKYQTYREVADWGSYATAIKVHIGNSNAADVAVYNELVDEVGAFFKAYNIAPTARNVERFKNEITVFVDEHFGTVPADWKVGELRCDKFV